MQNTAIIGLGLLGGSLGLALKKCPVKRLGWARRDITRATALELDAIDETSSDLEEILRKADTVVLALPIPVIIDYMPVCAKVCRPGTVITDIDSIKSEIMSAAEKIFTDPAGPYFAGSHPMAGTEKSGIASAFAELYSNADVFITPLQNIPDEAVAKIETLWQQINCHTSILDAEKHDRLVAETSHALHVVASALSLSILDNPDETEKLFRFRGCATGFKDTSRIASSSPRMWREIIEHNQQAVLAALDGFQKSLDDFRALIRSGDFDGFEEKFTAGKILRDAWLEYKGMK